MKSSIEIQWRCGISRRLRRVTIPCTLYFMIKWLFINVYIWLRFSQPVKHLLFYFPYKSCKHSLISICISSHQSSNVLISFRVLSWLHFFNRNTSIFFFLENCSLILLWFNFFSPQNYALISIIGYYIFMKENKKHLLRQGA